ncbi:PQ loop repeat-domain-containing protein [Syncephalastrum racemosum]|uniref:PQ loop repeat-domain-containing protein n=1 Tax=Syncephalastrum racemosum TaxID=13706 RepID=A0A1X2H394_SYNRA|nr:PQ loop repeat-domain-containing protein [Syncephalastrum racemosum]
MVDSVVASATSGYLSIVCWIIVFAPQLWVNYNRKNGDGLSMTFLVIWLAGDLFNLAGVILQDLLPTMFLLALWYTVADMGLIWQVLYYRRSIHRHPSLLEDTLIDEHAPLLSPQGIHSDASEDHPKKTKRCASNLIALVIIGVTTIGSCWAYLAIRNSHPDSADEPNEDMKVLPQVLGWTSAVLYVGSRIPQIVKNAKQKSTEGLSFGMFVCAVLGNVFFTMSIFLRSVDPYYLLINLSWIVGSVGTLVFDFLIFIQFFVYDRGNKR